MTRAEQPPAPRISAVLCTRDRAAVLAAALGSLRAQTLAAAQYEVVVVDNGSRDATPDLLRGLAAQWPQLRCVAEPLVGLSRARNRGWRGAAGEYVAFIDDDAVAAPDWLERILAAFDTVEPPPGCVAGKVEALWGAPRPAWLVDDLTGVLSVVDWSPAPCFLAGHQWIIGCNMAFPRGLLEACGGFAEDLGRRGDKLLSMEEVGVRRCIERAGHRAFYDPRIVVRHTIPAARLRRAWLLRRIYWNGVSTARLELAERRPSPPRRLANGMRALLGGRASPDASGPPRGGLFTRFCVFGGRLGYACGLWGLAR